MASLELYVVFKDSARALLGSRGRHTLERLGWSDRGLAPTQFCSNRPQQGAGVHAKYSAFKEKKSKRQRQGVTTHFRLLFYSLKNDLNTAEVGSII